MAAIPGAEYWGPLPSSNYAAASGQRTIIGMTVHHIDGSLAAADATFKSVGRGSSACYGVGRDGRIVYWLDPLWNFDYHACQAQWQGFIGVENESDPNNDDEPLTDAQIRANAHIAIYHRIPGVAITQQGQSGVGYHRMFSAGGCSNGWGNTDCPGDGVAGQIDDIVAAINGLPPNPDPDTGDDDMIYMTEDNGVKQYLRDAKGILVKIDNAQAYAHVLAGVRVVNLGGSLAGLAYNLQTKKAMADAGITP